MIDGDETPEAGLPAAGAPELPLREHARAPITIVCEARVGLSSWSRVFLQDLSTHGFQMGRVPGLRVGERLRLRVPGFELLSATVRWLDGEHAGCAFERPLAEYVLDHIVGQAGN
jgi:hypothetical protein